jgi:HKD family nuclease
VPLRVITTTYRGATERRALDELVRQFGAEVRIRYDAQSTRLHATAWLFRRNGGFDTGFVGSSNLSKSALLDGLEWNVRISAVATPTLVRKFEATFDTYWNNPGFRPYDPDRDGELLERALASEGSANSTITLSGLGTTAPPPGTNAT